MRTQLGSDWIAINQTRVTGFSSKCLIVDLSTPCITFSTQGHYGGINIKLGNIYFALGSSVLPILEVLAFPHLLFITSTQSPKSDKIFLGTNSIPVFGEIRCVKVAVILCSSQTKSWHFDRGFTQAIRYDVYAGVLMWATVQAQMPNVISMPYRSICENQQLNYYGCMINGIKKEEEIQKRKKGLSRRWTEFALLKSAGQLRDICHNIYNCGPPIYLDCGTRFTMKTKLAH